MAQKDTDIKLTNIYGVAQLQIALRSINLLIHCNFSTKREERRDSRKSDAKARTEDQSQSVQQGMASLFGFQVLWN